MADYAVLKAAIEDVIKTNGNNEITGQLLQNALVAMIDALGAGFQFAGVATPETIPGTPDNNVVYITGAGTYPNFGATVVPKGSIGIFSYNGSWNYDTVVISDTLPAYININELANHPEAYADAATALADVPQLYRRTGVKVVYLDDTQQTWIEMLNIDDAGANWWTDVTNNWIIEGPIETDVITPTGGKQLRIGGVKRGNLDDVLNVNVWNEQITEYETQAAARAAVPANKRKLGGIIIYMLADGWHSEQFIGSSISEWVNGAWSDVTNLFDYLNRTKQTKDWGSNLVNPNTVIADAYIKSDGSIGAADPNMGWGVTDFIPVLGQNIINNGIIELSFANHAVYDINKNFIRTINQTTQYTYQSGDYYIRFCYRNVTPQCNFGTTLAAYVPYTENATKPNVEKNTQNILDLDVNKLAKINGVNLIDPNKLLNQRYIRKTGEIRVAAESGFVVSGLIPINGNDIVMYKVIPNKDIIRPWVAYDANLNITRVGAAPNSNTPIYTFDSTNYPNDKYLRIGFNSTNVQEERANYGTTLADYVPYTDYKPIADLDKRVTVLENSSQELLVEMPNKLDKIPGTNLINPNELVGGKYISRLNGIINNGEARYYVSGYISVFDNNGVGQNISSNALKVNFAGTFVVYDINKNVLRVQYGSDGTNQYVYQDGDAFVRFGYDVGSSSPDPIPICLANYGDTLLPYSPYTEYKPIGDLDARITALENDGGGTTDFTLSFVPNCLYSVFNSNTNRQMVSRLYMSHLLNDVQLKNAEIFFENFIRNIPIVPTEVATKSETTKTYNITPKRKYVNKSFSTKLRITNCETSKGTTPRILVIGDSVTAAYGANSNKKISWLPGPYWAFAKMLFEMDKIDGGDNANEYNALFVGHFTRNFTIDYGGVQRLVYAHAEAEGGASLEQLFASTWGGYGTANPFYDETNQTFSINAYLAKYRTMDDLGVRLVSQSTNPAGESVVGSDGLTYTIGTEITNQTRLASWDVCKPTHIVVNLTHNTSFANYQTYAPQVISVLQTQLPGVPIIFMTIDETGGYFPCDYPNYNPNDITISSNAGLHSKNGQIYLYIKETLENETNGIYLLGAQFTQPTAKCYPTIDADYSENVCRDETPKFQIANPEVLGRTYHPNNLAHAAFGYSLYSIIKWMIS